MELAGVPGQVRVFRLNIQGVSETGILSGPSSFTGTQKSHFLWVSGKEHLDRDSAA